jgi:GT2 family glycosyltransferase
MDLRSPIALVVPAGRGAGSLALLLRSLVRSAASAGVSSLPIVHVSVRRDCPWSGEMDKLSELWRAAGGGVAWHVSERGNATAMRNRAVEALRTPWAAFLDDDVEVDLHYIARLAALVQDPPRPVVQGVPYLCSNEHRLLARLEARNYQQGLASYRGPAGQLATLDARNLFIATDLIRRFRFDETLLFAGEGQDLARRLAAAGIPIGYDESLRVYHRNRERLADLVRQKYAHGRGRAQLLRKTGDLDLRRYAARYVVRHFAEPMASMLTRRLKPSDALYRVATNAVFWAGTLREVARGDDA